MFSIAEIHGILRLINQFHIIFLGQTLGKSFLSKDDLKVLKEAGVDVAKMAEKDVVTNAFKLGLLARTLRDRKMRRMTYDQFTDFASSDRFIPLSDFEKEMVNSLKMALYSDIKGLGNRVSADFSHIAIEADKKQRMKYEKIIAQETKDAITDRKSVIKLASEIGHKTGDWSRDLDRIADYQLHRAYCSGKVALMLRGDRDPKDVKVYFHVFESACKECVKHYLTDGVGSQPKVFKLSDIINNGTNVGRKTKEWLPVVPPMHPWCRCEIEELMEGYAWNEEKKLFVLTRLTHGVKRKSKVRITVNGKEI